MPMLALMMISWPATLIGSCSASMMRRLTVERIGFRRRTATTIANSSPPSRATVSPARTQSRRRSAVRCSSSSPAPWPSVSLTFLNPSRSISTADGARRPVAGVHHLGQPPQEQRPVRQAGQRVVKRLVTELVLQGPPLGHLGEQGRIGVHQPAAGAAPQQHQPADVRTTTSDTSSTSAFWLSRLASSECRVAS